eukprot:3263656-Rhodomonas_salina.2
MAQTVRNMFEGPLPDLSGLTELSALNVQHNLLNGSIATLQGLLKLERVDVSFNHFSGSLQQPLLGLPLLRSAYIHANPLADAPLPAAAGPSFASFQVVRRGCCGWTRGSCVWTRGWCGVCDCVRECCGERDVKAALSACVCVCVFGVVRCAVASSSSSFLVCEALMVRHADEGSGGCRRECRGCCWARTKTRSWTCTRSASQLPFTRSLKDVPFCDCCGIGLACICLVCDHYTTLRCVIPMG